MPVSRGFSGQICLGTQNNATPAACLPCVTPCLSTYSNVLLICAKASKSGDVNESSGESDCASPCRVVPKARPAGTPQSMRQPRESR